MVTGSVALLTASYDVLMQLVFGSRWSFYGLILIELVLVVSLSGWISKMSASTAIVVFFVYAMINGLTFSAIP